MKTVNLNKYLFLLLFILAHAGMNGQTSASSWVDSVLNSLTLEEKIGQLFMVRAHSDLGPEHINSIKAQIKKYKLGGLCFFQGTPQKQAELTAEYHKLSKVPLLISMDAEWGLGMRHKQAALSFPYQIMLGAIPNVQDIEEMGFAIGKQLKAIGVHISFSPVADVNNNADNPVIGYRSFGEDKDEVAKRSIAYMKGLRSAGIIASGKHFPGHGDTDIDSHLDLPVIPHAIQRLREVELYPFQQLIDAGIPSIMVAHLHVPSIDSTPNISTTLSSAAINGLLKKEMGFKGLVITDALEMKGVTKNFTNGEIAIMAFDAGNDILLMPANIGEAFTSLKEGFIKGKLDAGLLDEKVRKILEMKYSAGLDSLIMPSPELAAKAAFDPYAVGIKHKLIEEAITVVQNMKALIPIVNLKEPRTATLAIGSTKPTAFQKRIDSYLKAKHYQLPKTFSAEEASSVIAELRKFPRVIVAIQQMNNKPEDEYGLNKDILALIQNINRQQELILVIFGNPYSLKYFENIDHLIMAYDDAQETQDITAQGIMGVFGFRGKLPVTASNIFPLHHGFTTPSLKRLGYSPPERVGMISDSLNYIQKIADQMIRIKAAPGCQVLIAKNGRIVYEKAFGAHTYSGKDTVRLTDLYDIASVTKIAATTISVMRLVEEGYINLDKTLGEYLPWIAASNKAGMPLRKVMSHHAGLQSWIPFYEYTLAQNRPVPLVFDGIYQPIPSSRYPVCVAESMWMDISYLDTIRQQIVRSGLNKEDSYVYSDLGFIMLPEIIRNKTGVSFEHYVDSVFYQPLDLYRLGFKPLYKFSPEEIVPSEIDEYFRCQELDGYVHDMACAMLGGVCGHAGLFSNASDLAVVFQMLLNGGYYGGKKFIDPEILKTFTTRYEKSTRRGIGFDMKELNTSKNLLTSYMASKSTYGHTGFTGICAWNDPEHELMYIFLSNRTFPTMNNPKMSNYNIRERIHSCAYRAINGYQSYTHDLIAG